jgi:hypothetical protein
LKVEYEAIIREQLTMNEQTWKMLLDRGVTEQTRLKLDFSFDAPNESAAESLVALIKSETDYDLLPPESAGGTWSVSGSTQLTSISLEILNQWVMWMVMAGKRGGGCFFDGWGTEIG